MKLGILGLPQVGRRTVFKLLTGMPAEKAPRKHGITQGIAPVRDPRIDRLVEMYTPKKMRYAEFDIALPPHVEPDATRGAEWLGAIRQTDALLHVVRAFQSPSVFHIRGTVDPQRDVDDVETELLLADLDLVDKRLERMHREQTAINDAAQKREKAILERFKTHLEQEQSLRTLPISEADEKVVRSLQLLTLKPMIVVFNADDDLDAAEAELEPLAEHLKQGGSEVVFLSAAIEEEMMQLDEEETALFMDDLNLSEPAAHRLSRAAYQSLGLISFFTVGPDEVRAWPVRRGATAPRAASVIHSDIERGFIRAETIAYDDLMKAGSEKAAKEKNLYRLNGKEYVVRDGDIIEFRFNV